MKKKRPPKKTARERKSRPPNTPFSAFTHGVRADDAEPTHKALGDVLDSALGRVWVRVCEHAERSGEDPYQIVAHALLMQARAYHAGSLCEDPDDGHRQTFEEFSQRSWASGASYRKLEMAWRAGLERVVE